MRPGDRRADLDVDDEQVLGELLRPGDDVAGAVEHERRAVEHELVLTADEVHVDDRHAGLRGATRRASPRARAAGPRSTATR